MADAALKPLTPSEKSVRTMYFTALGTHLCERCDDSFARLCAAYEPYRAAVDADVSEGARYARAEMLRGQCMLLLKGDRWSWMNLLLKEIRDDEPATRAMVLDYSPFKQCLSVCVATNGAWDVIGGGGRFEEASGAGTVALDLFYSCTLENSYGKRAGSRFRAYRIALKK